MFKKIKSRRGETLIEVLVATIVLIVGGLSATRLFALATVNNQLTKERVIATNLAREGLEAVRSIRDTNWLRFAGERRTCWNNLNPSECNDSDLDGVPDSVIGHRQNYVVEFDNVNYRWDLDSTDLDYRLNLTDGVNSDDDKYRLKIDADGLYNQSGSGTDTVFYREVYTEYLADDQSLAVDAEAANILRVTSKVEWYDRGKMSDVTLTTILTDYLARKNHD
ncbi:MAG: hypothetical protein K9L85_02530 [Candidatus Peribacteraceae bacterium]|nr:hypothetical protein [Candidatus Peribacteraceae bacterium]